MLCFVETEARAKCIESYVAKLSQEKQLHLKMAERRQVQLDIEYHRRQLQIKKNELTGINAEITNLAALKQTEKIKQAMSSQLESILGPDNLDDFLLFIKTLAPTDDKIDISDHFNKILESMLEDFYASTK